MERSLEQRAEREQIQFANYIIHRVEQIIIHSDFSFTEQNVTERQRAEWLDDFNDLSEEEKTVFDTVREDTPTPYPRTKQPIGGPKVKQPKRKFWYIRERHNPQLKTPYFTALGQLTVAQAKQREAGGGYGFNIVTGYISEELYVAKCNELGITPTGVNQEGSK